MTDHDAKILKNLKSAEFVVTKMPRRWLVEYAHLQGEVRLGELGINYGIYIDMKEWIMRENGDATGAMNWALEQTKAAILETAERVIARIESEAA